ncbi:MAG: phage tail protein [Capsulimonas sp.]|uniref:phage tail protein n=1 Tax=Capsulimonas sp. TaxID=2494211 RepID=UPI0032633E8F
MNETSDTSPNSTPSVPRKDFGVDLNLIPDELDVPLRAEPPANTPASLWHRVQMHPSAMVSLWSRDADLRIVRLTVAGNSPSWNPRWVRWTYAVRRAPELQGGAALDAQDMLSEDGATLTLLLLPGEQRSVTLEFLPFLDGETYTGDYPFTVVLTDAGDDRTADTPGRLRLTHPPAGLLDLLPSIYSGPSVSPSARFKPYEDPPFFTRFLRGFEDASEPLQELLSRRERFFDLNQAPADFLPWLAGWVSLTLDENWPELKRRRLIREAVDLYRWRGTRRGLSRYLEIYTGVVPRIEDQPFAGMRLGPESLLGRDTLLGGVGAHTFVVTLAVPDPRAVNERIVRDIIESEKPAHAAYDLRIVHRVAGTE